MTTIICKIKQKRGDRKKNLILKNGKTKAKIEEADWVFAVEQYEIENTYRQEKDEKLLKFLVLFS